MTAIICARVNTAALRANLALIRRTAPRSRVMAVVKANAYGHGLVPTALALGDVDAFAVARLEEGLQLRDAGVAQPIVLLEGVLSAAQLAEAAHRGFELVVHDPVQLELLEGYRGAHRFVLWLKADTGMNRLGFRAEAFVAALQRLRALAAPAQEIRALTHLARAEQTEVAMTHEQLGRFAGLMREAQAAAGGVAMATSIGNSAGVLAWPQTRVEWIRPGLALYGVAPFPGKTGRDLALQPAMSLETTVIATRRVPRGETVGYGGNWTALRDSEIAILAAGYGDGVPRQLPNGTPVMIGTARAPLVGRVSMDMIAVDVTGLAPVRVGDRAQLWGDALPVEEIAACARTIPWELLCAVRQRVPHEYV